LKFRGKKLKSMY